MGRLIVSVAVAYAVYRGDGLLRGLPRSRPIGDVNQVQVLAGRVHHVAAVGADARIEHRSVFAGGKHRIVQDELTGVCGDAILPDFGQEQLAVDGEHDATSGLIDGIGNDSGAAFARTLASRTFFGGNVLRIGIGQQFARIGKQDLPIVAGAGRVDHAHP